MQGKADRTRKKATIDLAHYDRSSIICAIFFLLTALFLLWKAKFGYIYNDEPYIITTSERLFQGDALLVDDWFPAQLVGFINLPFFMLYHGLTGGVEGIVLFYRYCYVILWTGCLAACFLLLKEKVRNPYILLAGCLYLLLFTSLDQMTLSYNFWALGSLLMIIALEVHHKHNWEDYLAGFFTALAVLANPYLAVVYFGCLMVVAVMTGISRGGLAETHCRWENRNRRMLRITFGIVPIFIIFLCFVLSRSSVAALLQSIPHVLGNSGYQSRSILHLVISPLVKKLPFDTFIGIPTVIVSWADQHRKEHASIYLILQVVVFIASMLLVLLHTFYWFNLIMFPLTVFGLQIYVLDKDSSALIRSISLLGLAYTACLLYSSDLGMTSMCLGFSILGFAAFLEIDHFSQINVKEEPKIRQLLSAVMIIQLIFELGVRVVRSYWDQPVWNLNTVITAGSARGIITTSATAQNYLSTLSEAETSVSCQNSCRILILPLNPSLYLDLNCGYGSYDTFTEESDQIKIATLEEYYAVHPENYPEKIYILKENGTYNTDYLLLLQGKQYSVDEYMDRLIITVQEN